MEKLSLTLKQEYDKTGISIIPNVFSAAECDEIKKHAYAVTDNQIRNSGYPHAPSETAYNKRSLIFFPALANDYLNKIRTDDRLVEIVKFFAGNDVKQINNQIYFRESGDHDQFAWHQDIIFRESNNFNSNIECDYFQTIIAVDDITLENGAVEFIEGSHKTMNIPKPSNLRIFERNGLSGKKYIAKKGDVMIWSVMIVHGSEPNYSNNDRMTYMNGFCKATATSAYPDYLVNGQVVYNMNPKLIP